LFYTGGMMKVLKVAAFVLIAGLGLTGCEEKNEEYYLKNLDSANEKLEKCSKALNEAFISNDENALEKLKEDAECKAASNAIQKDKQLKYELAKQRQEAERKQALEKELNAIKTQLAGKSWQASINEYLKVEGCRGLFASSDNYKCKAWDTIYKEKVDEGKNELKQLPFDDIKTKMFSICKLDKRHKSNCDVAQSALEEKAADELANADIQTIESQEPHYCSDDIRHLSACRKSWDNAWDRESKKYVKQFIENDEEFINTFNSCVDKMTTLETRNDISWQEKDKIRRSIKETYPCAQAKDAYIKRGMGYTVNFKEKIEK
jgi:hypothetical protein